MSDEWRVVITLFLSVSIYFIGYYAGRLHGRAEVMPRGMAAEDEPSVAPVQAIRRAARNTSDPERLVEPRPLPPVSWRPAPAAASAPERTSSEERRYTKLVFGHTLWVDKPDRGSRN